MPGQLLREWTYQLVVSDKHQHHLSAVHDILWILQKDEPYQKNICPRRGDHDISRRVRHIYREKRLVGNLRASLPAVAARRAACSLHAGEFQKLAELSARSAFYADRGGYFAGAVPVRRGGQCHSRVVQFRGFGNDIFFLLVDGQQKSKAGTEEKVLYLMINK